MAKKRSRPSTKPKLCTAPLSLSDLKEIEKRAVLTQADFARLAQTPLAAGPGAHYRPAEPPPDPPPLLIGGVVKGKHQNTGAQVQLPVRVESHSFNENVKIVLTEKGPKFLPLQRPQVSEKCSIDYLSFSVSEHVLQRLKLIPNDPSDDGYLEAWADYCIKALLRIPAKLVKNRAGLFNYEVAGRLAHYGLVAAGSKSGTLYVQFSGHAFACADDGFSQRLYDFLSASPSANITRIDICYDDLEGELFPVLGIPERWQNREFTMARSPRSPKFEQRGDWFAKDPEGHGLTAYIGSRSSGKLIRIYEKGKQLGQPDSPWVRAEVELRDSTFFLPAEMLIHPTAFFVMMAPAFVSVEYAGAFKKLERKVSETIFTVDQVLDVIRHQFGGYLHVLRDRFYETDSELFERISRVPNDVPYKLQRALDLLTTTSLED